MTQPGDIRWLAAGTPAAPAGVPVPLTDGLRAAVAAALNGGTPTPTPVPTPPAGRKPAGRQEWAKPSSGGEFAGWDVVGRAEDAAADLSGIRVTAAKSGIALRDLSVRNWSNGLTVEHVPAVLSGRLKNWTVRRVSFADNCGPPLYRGQGAYVAAADDWLFDGCWFVGNGRAKDKRVGVGQVSVVVGNGFSHGAYVQGGLSQWSMPEGCRRVRFRNCVFAGNAAWGALCKGDGCEVDGCIFVGNAYGMLLNGPLPCKATNNVVIPGPRPAEWYAGQRGGAGGIQWRTASGTLADNLCVLPPENRMPDRNWRAPAFELTLDANAKPNYHGPVTADGGNNVALGWDDDVVTRGVPVPGFRKGPCPPADWAGFAVDVERRARAGTADAAALIATARRMAGQ